MGRHEPLQVSATVSDVGSSSAAPAPLRKAVLNALPSFINALQKIADENVGSEAIFIIFSKAEEWFADGEWEALQHGALLSTTEPTETDHKLHPHKSIHIIFGRRLIYSHHIISKVKRAEIKELAADYQLTGYMKIGWPGLLIVEGREQDCLAFYDSIRRWNWQYLVVRGEQRDDLVVAGTASEGETVQDYRKFKAFLEVDDMSIVAQHCRDVGLEALFRTSMKQYDGNNSTHSESSESDGIPYGALVHVDHMNDPKGYRKWLQKTAMEIGCQFLLRQTYPLDDYSKRPRIFVCIVGDSSTDVSNFLKRWRTSRVDVDSRGKACMERMMTVLVEDALSPGVKVVLENMEEENASSWTTTDEQLQPLLHAIGGVIWKEACISSSHH
jgi:hypothetical protein